MALNIWQNKSHSKEDFYIRHCILYDYSRQRTYYFCCYTWLSTRKNIGVINEVFYVAQEVDQYAFGHLFLCTFAWLYYHYQLVYSVFGKQRMNTLTRVFRFHLYFFLVILQMYLIQWTLMHCRKSAADQRCLRIVPAFAFLADQSFVESGWTTVYQVQIDRFCGRWMSWHLPQIIRRNLLPSLCVSLLLSSLTALLTPLLIWCSTWLTNRLELYRQLLDVQTDSGNLHSLHGAMHTLASSITDFHSYFQDVEQFRYMHKFNLQHRLSVSTLDETDKNEAQADLPSNSSARASKSERVMIFYCLKRELGCYSSLAERFHARISAFETWLDAFARLDLHG